MRQQPLCEKIGEIRFCNGMCCKIRDKKIRAFGSVDGNRQGGQPKVRRKKAAF